MPVKKNRTFEDYYPGYSSGDEPFEIRTTTLYLGAISAAGNYIVFVAPADIKIVKARLVTDAAIAVDASHYYDFNLVNMTQEWTLSSSNTSLNSSATLAAHSPKDLTPDQNTYLRKDDVLRLRIGKEGSPENLSGAFV